MGSLQPRTTVVPIYQGDDADRIADLRSKVERAAMLQRASRLDDEGDAFAAAVNEYGDFLDTAFERAVKVRLAALRKNDWRDLIAEHPAREDRKDGDGNVVESFDQDHEVGFDVDAMAEPLVAATLDRVEALDLEQGLDREDVDELSDADFNRIYNAAVELNMGAGPDPKARLSSPRIPTSSETSGLLERLD